MSKKPQNESLVGINRRDVLKLMAGTAAGTAAAGFLTGCDARSPMSTATPAPTVPSTGTISTDPAILDLFDYPRIESLLPFAHGVASGDPMTDRVIIWTRITIPDPAGWNLAAPQGISSVDVNWVIATDPGLTNIINQGTLTTDASRDWTIKIDATGLQPATTYYYAFGALGETSIIGRTKTAPDNATSQSDLRFAVVSCSSYWSSHWDGYGHIADRNDLDAVIHLGDYIYDFVDQDEQVRARVDRNGDTKDNGAVADSDPTWHPDYYHWLNRDECRRRYALYRSEPNLLRAHQQHPWIIIWDNHDIDHGTGNELGGAPDAPHTTTLDDTCEVFWEWVPCRPPIDDNGTPSQVNDGTYVAPVVSPRQLWRKLPYGPLADIICTDIELYRQEDAADRPADNDAHLSSGSSLLGKRQYEFITGALTDSVSDGKTWRILPHQTWWAPWNIPSPAPGSPTPAGSPIATRWENFKEERAQLFQFMRDNGIDNNVVLAGDMHGNWASDLIADNTVATAYRPGLSGPNDVNRQGSFANNTASPSRGYTRTSTGNTAILNNRAESVGVEFAPSSMGRGGADELVANASGQPVQSPSTIQGARGVEQATIEGNKNVQFMEWVEHGYGIVHLTADEAVFEFWWQDKLTEGAPDVLGCQMVTFAADDTSALPAPKYKNQIDDVRLHGRLTDVATVGSTSSVPAPTPGGLVQT